MPTVMCITSVSARTDRYSYLRRWRSDEYGSEYSRVEWKNPVTTCPEPLDPEKFSEFVDLEPPGRSNDQGG